MMNGLDWCMGWGMGFGWLFWLFIIGLIVWGVKTLTGNRNPNVTSRKQENAMEILQKRYALGEIDFEEFEERRQTLQG